MLQFRKDLSPGGWDKSVSRSCHVHLLVPVVVADDQGVKAVRSGEIGTDDQFLSAIHAIFDPGAAPLGRLVVAVLLFADNSFEPLLAHRGQKVVWRLLDII
jgi:hypothetical protein